MASGEADVEAANPPANLEPRSCPISKAAEPGPEANEEPNDEHYKGCLQENILGLGVLLD